mgnify:CR=1 FL=1
MTKSWLTTSIEDKPQLRANKLKSCSLESPKMFIDSDRRESLLKSRKEEQSKLESAVALCTLMSSLKNIQNVS